MTLTHHRVSVEAPVVAHKGPRDTDAALLRKAAWNLENGYELGGGNLTAAVIKLLQSTSEALEHNPRSAENADGDLIELGANVVHAGSGRRYTVRGLYVEFGGRILAQCFSVESRRTTAYSIERLRPIR